MKLVRQIWNDDRGQDLIEYALLAGFLALAAVATMGTLRGQIAGLFDAIGTQLGTAAGGGN